jgi:transketolase
VTAEDHWPEGGLGDAVLDVFADTDERPRIVKLAVRHLPGSATPAEQLATAGIDGDHIADAARSLLRGGLVGAGTGSGSSAYLERREADDVGSSRRE